MRMIHGQPVYLRWTPLPAMVTIRDNKDHIGVLLYPYHSTISYRVRGPPNVYHPCPS